MGDRLVVGRVALDHVAGVRILLPQPLLPAARLVVYAAPSSRGLGHGPLKAETRVRIPLGPPTRIRWSFPRKISVRPPRGRKPLLHATSVLVEQVHDFLEIVRRQPCVDRRLLDIRMA